MDQKLYDNLRLLDNEIHLWNVSVVPKAHNQLPFESILSKEELARARRFRFEKDQLCSATARGMLRTLLGRYLQKDPKNLEFKYNEYGKPELADPSPQPSPPRGEGVPLQFNVSHSKTTILLAFTLDHPIGVDVEYVDPKHQGMEIAERYFSKPEMEWLKQIPKANQEQAFFKIWTLKEAFIKAVGEGLSYPLHDFCVLEPGQKEPRLKVFKNPKQGFLWSVKSFEPKPSYLAAVAIPIFKKIIFKNAS